MREVLVAAVVAASLLVVPASAANTLKLVCKCQSVVVNGEERGCAGQSNRVATIDLDAKTLQWTDGPGYEWPAIPATISGDTITAGVEYFKEARANPGGLALNAYTINRISGDFEESGWAHITDRHAPNVDFRGPAAVTGICTKADAPKF